MAFGKFFLLPVIGGTLFGWLTYALKTLHNFVGPLFAVSLVIVFFTFLRDNLPRRGDLHWLRRVGGMLGGKEPPSHRFNAGEKVVFWGGVLAARRRRRRLGPGARQDAPGPRSTRAARCRSRTWSMPSRTMLMMAMFIGHIYIGTIGMRGAYQAMRDRLCRRGLGRGAPRALVRRHRGRQDSGAAHAPRRAPRAGAGRPQPDERIPTMRPCVLSSSPPAASRSPSAPALAKLPPPSDEAKAKAAEAAAKAAWSDKVGAYQLCQVAGPRRRRTTAPRRADGRQGRRRRRDADAAVRRSRARSQPRRSRRAGVTSRSRPSGAHSPPGTATSPPSNNGDARAEIDGPAQIGRSAPSG